MEGVEEAEETAIKVSFQLSVASSKSKSLVRAVRRLELVTDH